MKDQDKQLLLVDLCARLPHGVKIRLGDYDYQVCGYNSEKEQSLKIWFYYDSNLTLKSYIDVYLTDYRPYLRPMSSMTEDEKGNVNEIIDEFADRWLDSDVAKDKWDATFWQCSEIVNYLNSIHVDYRGLIDKGLALEAPEGMYN